MKVTIKEWNTVATWRWDIPEDDVCGICQVHFDGTCPTCKYPGDDCSLRKPSNPSPNKLDCNLIRNTVSGKCGHSFHMASFAVPHKIIASSM
jgi:anaphase-promoting complex subunit 11